MLPVAGAIINSGNKAFDRQANSPTQYFGEGNVHSNTQYSMFIRGFLNTECNGRQVPPAQLRDFDLRPFRVSLQIPRCVENAVLEATTGEESVVLYVFFHLIGCKFTDARKRIVHGWVLTKNITGWKKGGELLGYWVAGNSSQSRSVIDAMLPYISSDPPSPAP